MATKNEKSVFEILNAIDCNEHVEQIDNGKKVLTYLSWAWAWTELKKAFPDASYTIYENAAGLNYHTDGRTCWVKTGVTVNGLEYIEYLPIMDNRHASITLENVKSTDVNKAIQRSLTKAAARHGLGLYIYAGEDLPEAVRDDRLSKACEAVEKCVSRAELQAAWETYKEYQTDKKFREACRVKGDQFPKEAGKEVAA